MSRWKDQAPFDGETLCEFYHSSSNLMVEVEKAGSGDAYRITVGTLFQSESVLIEGADNAMRALGVILAKASESETFLPSILPGFKSMEPRVSSS